MKTRPILFSAPMVRAILDGRKTQTRRVMKTQPTAKPDVYVAGLNKSMTRKELVATWDATGNDVSMCISPYGQVGDRLWVRETFCPIYPQDQSYNNGEPIEYDYKATYQHGNRLGDYLGCKKLWEPSIHMPREASRILLEITDVRVERLQDISEADAIAEGIEPQNGGWKSYQTYHTGKYKGQPTPTSMLSNKLAIFSYEELWESINGENSWSKNPWVWIIEFKRIEV